VTPAEVGGTIHVSMDVVHTYHSENLCLWPVVYTVGKNERFRSAVASYGMSFHLTSITFALSISVFTPQTAS